MAVEVRPTDDTMEDRKVPPCDKGVVMDGAVWERGLHV